MSDRVTRPMLLGAVGLICCLAAAREARAQVDSTRAADSTQVGDSTGVVPAPSPAARSPALSQQAEPVERQPGARWRTSWFPYLTGGANDSPVLAFRVRHWQPAE